MKKPAGYAGTDGQSDMPVALVVIGEKLNSSEYCGPFPWKKIWLFQIFSHELS
jgi:hypothetical protein